MTKNLDSWIPILNTPIGGYVSACYMGHEATCHAAKDHAVQRRKWDYSFIVA